MLEERVEGGTDLPDLGAFVGEVLGHPLGEVDLALGERQLGDGVRRRRHLAQRPQLTAYDDQGGAGADQHGHACKKGFPPDEGRQRVVDVRGWQAGYAAAAIDADGLQ